MVIFFALCLIHITQMVAAMQTVIPKKISIPLHGIGTLRLEQQSLEQGLRNGLRVVDTAKAYGNEEMVGNVIKKFPESATVITKLYRPNCENKQTLRNAVQDSIKKLGKVPEFFLIHGPYPDVNMLSLLAELELMKEEQLVKEWGVSNFDTEHLEVITDHHGFVPALNQVEYHPLFQRANLLKFCKFHRIIMQAYRPLCEGKILEDPTIKKIANAHNVNAAAVVYSWLAQQQIPMVAKVSSDEHQKEYLTQSSLALSDAEMNEIAVLNQPDGKGRTCTKGGWFVPFSEEIKRKWLE